MSLKFIPQCERTYCTMKLKGRSGIEYNGLFIYVVSLKMCKSFLHFFYLFNTFCLIFQIVETLENISSDTTFTTSSPSDAKALLLGITDFGFVITLIVVKKCLGYMKQLTTVLQGRSLDVVAGFQHIDTIKQTLEQVCTPLDK